MASNGKETASTPRCSKHTNKELKAVCQTCLTSLCSICKTSHGSHELLETDIGPRLLQMLCSMKVPGCMEILHDLRAMQDGEAPQILVGAKEAILKSQEYLFDVIKSNTEKLLREIDCEIDKKKEGHDDSMEDCENLISNVDTDMERLTDARNEDDAAILMDLLHESDNDIQEAKLFLNDLKDTDRAISLDDVIPHQNDLDYIESLIDNYYKTIRTNLIQLNADSPSVDREPKDKWVQATAAIAAEKTPFAKTKKVKRLVSKWIGEGCYKISESLTESDHTVTIYRHCGNDIHSFDIGDYKLPLHGGKCDVRIWKMVTLSASQHVIVEDSDMRDVHLIDENYEIVATLQQEFRREDYVLRGLSIIAENILLLTECSQTDKKTAFTELFVENNQFSITKLGETSIRDCAGCITMCADGVNVMVTDSFQSLCVINIYTGEVVQKIDLEEFIGPWITSVYCGPQGMLVGDHWGKVHYIENGEHNRVIVKVKKGVSGLCVRGNKIIVTFGSDLHVYR